MAIWAPRLPGHLTGEPKSVNCRFAAMATMSNPMEDAARDFEYPRREAAFFYGLFLRGHSADELRRDIEVPPGVLANWDKETVREPQLRPVLDRVARYRRQVLAIFDSLVGHDSSEHQLQ